MQCTTQYCTGRGGGSAVHYSVLHRWRTKFRALLGNASSAPSALCPSAPCTLELSHSHWICDLYKLSCYSIKEECRSAAPAAVYSMLMVKLYDLEPI